MNRNILLHLLALILCVFMLESFIPGLLAENEGFTVYTQTDEDSGVTNEAAEDFGEPINGDSENEPAEETEDTHEGDAAAEGTDGEPVKTEEDETPADEPATSEKDDSAEEEHGGAAVAPDEGDAGENAEETAEETSGEDQEQETGDATEEEDRDAEETEPEAAVTAALNFSNVVLGVGDSGSTVRVTYSDGVSSRETVFTSSNPKVVTVSADGRLTGKAKGSAVITAETEFGCLTCDVTVLGAPSSVKISVSASEIFTGDKAKADPVFSGGYFGSVKYTSSDTNVLTVDENGVITAIGTGKAKIKVTTFNGKYAQTEITVYSHPENITLSMGSETIGAGCTRTVKPILKANEKAEFSYASSDDGVAAVSASGVITAVGCGQAVITVTADNGVHADITVTVLPAPQSVSFAYNGKKWGVGEVYSISELLSLEEGTFADYSVKSSASYITVQKDGTLKAAKAGSATVTVTLHNGLTAQARISVGNAPSKISLSASSIKLAEGDTAALTYKLPDSSAGSVKYYTSDASVAVVSQDGTVKAVSAGSCTVTAQTYNNKTASCTVNVFPVPDEVWFLNTSYTMGVGETGFSVKPEYTDGSYTTFTYSSSDESIVSVSSSGALTAKAKGNAVITATAACGLTCTCDVTVNNAPGKLMIDCTEMYMMVSTTAELPSWHVDEGASANGVSVSFSSSRLKQNGNTITASGAGSVTVTYKLYNGVKASFKVIVKAKPGSVTFSKHTVNIGMGETAALTAAMPKDTWSKLSYTNSDSGVVSYENDLLRPLSPGTAVITVTTENGKQDICTVNVYPAPESISLADITLGTGETGIYAKAVLPEGTLATISYLSDDTSVVQVDAATGLLKAKAAGTAVITASAPCGVSASCTVTVKPAPKTLTLSFSSVTFMASSGCAAPEWTVNDGAYANGASVSFSSNKIKIEDGRITSASAGSYTITYKLYNGVKATLKVYVKSKPASVSFSKHTIDIGAGESCALSAALPKDTYSILTYYNSDETAAVYDGGRITALNPGTSTITVTTENGKTDACTVNVYPAPEYLTMEDVCMGVSEPNIYAKAVFPEGTLATVSYSSDNPAVAQVDPATGLIKAKAIGTAVITANTPCGVSAVCAVNVFAAPKKLTAEAAEICFMADSSAELPAWSVNEGAFVNGISVSCSSSKLKRNGNTVTSAYTGTYTVTYSAYNGARATVKVRVLSKPSKVTLDAHSLTIGVGQTVKLAAALPSGSASRLTWESGEPSVIVTAPDGSVTAKSEGETFVTVQTENGKTDTCAVIVLPAPQSLEMEGLTMGVGLKGAGVKAVLPEGTAAEIRYTSSNENIVKVDPSNGSLTALSDGEAEITAVAHNGVSTTCMITVKKAPTAIILEYTARDLMLGSAMELPQWKVADDEYAGEITVKSSSSYFKIADNTVSGSRTGTYTLTYTLYNGAKATCRIAVKNKPSWVKLSEQSVNLGVDCLKALSVSLPSNTASEIALESADTDIAVIESGCVRGVNPGKTVITVYTENGKTATCAVSVLPAPEEIYVSAAKTAGVGMEGVLTAEIPEGCLCDLSYESSDTDVISVDKATGKWKAVAPGSAEITAYASNSAASAACAFTVLTAPDSIIPESDAVTLWVGAVFTPAYTLSPEESCADVTVSTSSKSVMSPNPDGTFTAKAAGSATLTYTAHNGKKCSVRVTVKKAAYSIRLNKGLIGLESGETFAFTYTIPSGTYTTVAYTSDNPDIATVTADGTVTAISTGTAIITARTGNGLTAKALVTVNPRQELVAGSDMKVTFFDIGRNDGILIECDGEYAFIDSGAHAEGKIALEYLRELGIDHLKYYIGTHAHFDHIGGAPVLLANLQVDSIIIPHSRVEDEIKRLSSSKEEKAASSSAYYQIMKRGDVLYLGSARLDCIGPISIKYISPQYGPENENSLVLRLENGDNSILLTGDSTSQVLRSIAQKDPEALQADVLKNAHHDNPLAKDVLDAIGESITVFSTSAQSQPKEEYLSELESRGDVIYNTAPTHDGSVTLLSDGKEIRRIAIP